MSTKPTLFFALTLWLCTAYPADAQFPYLHIYLNTPNCYAHSMGAMMLDSIDQRCAKTLVLSEMGQRMMPEVVASLGLRPNSVALRTIPAQQFNGQLWQGGFSRFVFGIDGDTLYDTNLDFLFQYADSINTRIAKAGSVPILRFEPSLVTSGSIASTNVAGGEVLLFDEYLNRMIRCKVPTDGGAITYVTLQMPESLDGAMSAQLKTSNLLRRGVRYKSLCGERPGDGSTRMFATLEQGVDEKGWLQQERMLLTFPAQGPTTACTFKALKGYGASAEQGALVNDTLYMQTYRSEAEELEVHFGTFLRSDSVYLQVKQPKHAEAYPTSITDKLHGNFSNGFFAGSSFLFSSFPLMYDAPTGTYHEIGSALGLSLDTVIARLSKHQFGAYYCSNALANGRTLTLLYWQDRVLRNATIDLVHGKLLRSGMVHMPQGSTLTTVLLEADRVLVISDDHVHAWIVPLE